MTDKPEPDTVRRAPRRTLEFKTDLAGTELSILRPAPDAAFWNVSYGNRFVDKIPANGDEPIAELVERAKRVVSYRLGQDQ